VDGSSKSSTWPLFVSYLEPDTLLGADTIRDIYEKSGDEDGKYTVPILYDKKLHTILSNESADIIRMLNSEFNEFAKYPELDLYPSDDERARSAINEVNEWVYQTINNGVYRCGFASTQTAYNKAITELTDSFDRLESMLSTSRFLAGGGDNNKVTEADIRLFVTLLRFDEVYVVYFKTNTRTVAGSSVLLNYCRDIYQMPGVADTANMEQIKTHYYTSHPVLNAYSIIPRGPDFEALLKEPHNRDKI
jgi:putative glutathione S-transferase